MIKKIVVTILIFAVACIPVSAQETDSTYYNKAEEFADEYHIDFENLREHPFESIWDTAKKAVMQGITSPLKIFYKISAILLITSFVSFFAADFSKQTVQTVNTVTMLVLFANVSDSFMELLAETAESLFNMKNFMTAFLPTIAGFSFASGEVLTSTVYTGFFMLCVVGVADFCINCIIPSVKLFLAVSITSSVSSVINLRPLCDGYSKLVKVAMTAAVSVLCFVLTIQTAVTQSQDTLAVKTGKLIVGSAVPVIGSALQSAVGSVYAGVGVIKGFVGIAGIIVIINMFLPSIVTLAVNWLGYYAMMILSGILDNKTASEILSGFKEVTEIMLSMSVLFMVLLIFSLTVMIKITQGA